MIKSYMFFGLLVLTMMVSGVFVWQRFQIDGLEKQVEQKDTEIVMTQEMGKVENFRIKWETVVKEHNKSIKEYYEPKDPIQNYDNNITDFYFFGLFRTD